MAYDFHHTSAVTWLDYLKRHKEWGWHTFGSPEDGRGPLGPYDHIGKELVEVNKSPTDLKEWIDICILSLDGMLRSGANIDSVAAILDNWYVTDKGCPRRTILEVERVYKALAGDIEIKGKLYKKATLNFMWGDMFDFAVGGFLCHGGKMEELLPMMFAKQLKNSLRVWPDWRGKPMDKAIEHVRGTHD